MVTANAATVVSTLAANVACHSVHTTPLHRSTLNVLIDGHGTFGHFKRRSSLKPMGST
jgi:hypothetical protein